MCVVHIISFYIHFINFTQPPIILFIFIVCASPEKSTKQLLMWLCISNTILGSIFYLLRISLLQLGLDNDGKKRSKKSFLNLFKWSVWKWRIEFSETRTVRAWAIFSQNDTFSFLILSLFFLYSHWNLLEFQIKSKKFTQQKINQRCWEWEGKSLESFE